MARAMRLRLLVLVSLVVTGCTRPADRWLDRIDPVEPGDACPNGGNVVRYGADTNHDGMLEDGEASSTQYLCNPAPPPGAPLLQRSDAVKPGPLCAAGGTRVSVGPDTNGNGTLDDSEIAQSSVVCATPPPAVLVRTSAEPADATCANGGTLVESGPDRNGDGKLEDAEVERSAHVCNASDKAALVRLDAEPKGAHCPYGGTAVRSGLDVNGDGTLEDSEISSTSYACDPPPVVTTLYGDHVIHAQADVDAFKGIQRLAGALAIDQCSLASVSLPELQTIEGALSVTKNATLTSIAIDNLGMPLRSLDVEGNALLTSLSVAGDAFAPTLTVTGDVTISNNAALTGFSNVALTQLDGTLRVESNAALTIVSANQALTKIGGSVIVRKNPALVVATLPYVLEIGGDLDIEDNDKLYNLMSWDSGWRLKTIGGSLIIAGNATMYELRGLDLVNDIAGGLTVERTPQLDNMVNLGGLHHVGGDVTLRDNLLLTTLIGFEALTSIDGSLVITGNKQLTQFYNVEQLGSVGGDIRIENNPALLDAGLPANLTRTAFGKFGTASVIGNPLLEGASFPHLTDGNLRIVSNPVLSTLSLPNYGGGTSLEIGQNAALDTFAAPALTIADWFMLHDNPALATLSVPKLTRVDTDFQARNNPKLAECAVDAVVKQLTTKPSSVDIAGNDTHATCP